MENFNSWGQKFLRVHVDMINGTRYTFQDFAMAVKVEKVALPDLPKAEVTIHGISLETMSQITCLTFKKNAQTPNKLIIEAGYSEDKMSTIFIGNITTANGDFNSAPDVVFQINATSGLFAKVKPVKPTSVNKAMTVEDFVKNLAGQGGLNTEFNKGQSLGNLNNQLITGSPVDQVKKAGETVGADAMVDNETIVMLPRGEARLRPGIFTLSKDNGLIGYPSFNEEGVSITCFFNPNLTIGGIIQLDSVVPRATGRWKITRLDHSLSVNTSGEGEWRSNAECVYIEG